MKLSLEVLNRMMKFRFFFILGIAFIFVSCKCSVSLQEQNKCNSGCLEILGKVSDSNCRLECRIISSIDKKTIPNVYVSLLDNLSNGEEGFTDEEGKVIFDKFSSGVYKLTLIKEGKLFKNNSLKMS